MEVQRFVSFQAVLSSLDINPHALESPRCKCLEKYISELDAKSYVIENDYTDPGYLLDYSNYYARSHELLQKRTKRIHFFRRKSESLQALWDESLGAEPRRRDAIDKLASATYLGFVVVKPLPLTIIGRSCLRTYSEDDKEDKRTRHFPILRTYNVTLFGLRLEIRSVAFQEQDAEVAACATTAIWYALHGLTKRYTTYEIPSPYEITNQGSDNMPTPTPGKVARKFPSSGLSVPQINSYFRRCGLDSIVVNLDPLENPSTFLDNVAAFVRGRAPILLMGELYASDEGGEAEFEDLGYHAMTVLGFSVEDGFKPGPSADRIARLFAHDDNVGPFSSFQIDRVPLTRHHKLTGDDLSVLNGRNGQLHVPDNGVASETTHLLNVSGLEARSGQVYRRIVPNHLVIPIDPKVRFPYETVRDFAEALYEIAISDSVLQVNALSWFIELRDIADFKEDIRSATWIDHDSKRKILCESMPRHLWILRFSVEGSPKADTPIIEFMFDATALRQSGGLRNMLTTSASKLGVSVLAAMFATIEDEVLVSHGKYKHLDSPDIRPCLRTLVDLIKTGPA